MACIRTILGDISPDEAGVTLPHEHIRYAYAGWEYDHRNTIDVDSLADDIAKVMRAGVTEYGIRTMVDLTPAEIGRNPHLIAECARRSGMNVVAATGFYTERQGIPFYWRRKSVDYIAEMMMRDLTEGMVYDGKQTSYKAGTMKVATGGWAREPSTPGPNGRLIGFYEDRAIRAAGRAQRRTGASINTHTQTDDYAVTNPGIELMDIFEEEGADPSKIIIGHVFAESTFDQLMEVCARGGNLQVDHIGIPWAHKTTEQLDELMAVNICKLADRGHIDKILLSYDRFFSHGRGPEVTAEEPEQFNARVHIGFLFDSFAPRLEKKGFGKAELKQVLVDNPRRVLSF